MIENSNNISKNDNYYKDEKESSNNSGKHLRGINSMKPQPMDTLITRKSLIYKQREKFSQSLKNEDLRKVKLQEYLKNFGTGKIPEYNKGNN